MVKSQNTMPKTIKQSLKSRINIINVIQDMLIPSVLSIYAEDVAIYILPSVKAERMESYCLGGSGDGTR